MGDFEDSQHIIDISAGQSRIEQLQNALWIIMAEAQRCTRFGTEMSVEKELRASMANIAQVAENSLYGR